MDKNDEDLTRLAIEEILRETKEQKEGTGLPRSTQERKINPLGKTNKHFLGRTLNAIVRHNERTEDQNRRNCHKKLKELNRQSGHSRKSRRTSIDSTQKKNKKKRRKKEQFSESEGFSRHKKRKHSKSKRKKKNKSKKSQRRNSSSSSSSGHFVDDHDRKKRWPQLFETGEHYEVSNVDMQEYSENIAACMVQPMFWTAHMQQLYQQKALIGLSSTQIQSTETVQIEELSLSSSSLSDVNFDEVVKSEPSLNVMLTINLSTDEEEEPSKVPSLLSKSLEKPSAEKNTSIEVSDSDSCDTDGSCAIIEVNDSDGDQSSQSNSTTGSNDSDKVIGSENNIIPQMSIEPNGFIAFDLTDE